MSKKWRSLFICRREKIINMGIFKKIHADIVIIGAGIAGLWLLNRLVSLGYQAILIDNQGIGGFQTLHSQGIIHGGAKYALTGSVTKAAMNISHMTKLWSDCVSGKGEIDLSTVKILSHHHLLWTRGRFTAGLKSFISSKILVSDSAVLNPKNYPEVFKNAEFFGSVCQCEETVFDVGSLIEILAKPHRERILLSSPETQFIWGSKGLDLIKWEDVELTADQFVFTAGEGVEKLLEPLENSPKMQRRPLHMVYLKAPKLPKIYAHCIESGTKPRVTITTHTAEDGREVWYLGGEIAEQGVKRNSEEQIKFAQSELQELLPWVNLSQAKWHSFLINRAEGEMPNHTRPDVPIIKKIQNIQVVWPTKLTFAPLAAAEVLKNLQPVSQKTDQAILDLLGIKKAPLLAALWNQ